MALPRRKPSKLTVYPYYGKKYSGSKTLNRTGMAKRLKQLRASKEGTHNFGRTIANLQHQQNKEVIARTRRK